MVNSLKAPAPVIGVSTQALGWRGAYAIRAGLDRRPHPTHRWLTRTPYTRRGSACAAARNAASASTIASKDFFTAAGKSSASMFRHFNSSRAIALHLTYVPNLDFQTSSPKRYPINDRDTEAASSSVSLRRVHLG